MKWFKYTITWNGRSREVIRPMGAGQAEALGAELVPDFEPAQRVAGVLVATFPPEGALEKFYEITAEAPAGRLGS